MNTSIKGDFQICISVPLSDSDAYSEPYQTPKMECFAKIVTGKKALTFFIKHSILDVW